MYMACLGIDLKLQYMFVFIVHADKMISKKWNVYFYEKVSYLVLEGSVLILKLSKH